MRKLRIFIVELILAGIFVGWLLWKLPELVDTFIPWIVWAILAHLTWEIVLEREKLKSYVGGIAEKRKSPMVWLVAFALGGLVSVGYMWLARISVEKLTDLSKVHRVEVLPDKIDFTATKSQALTTQPPSLPSAPAPDPNAARLQELQRELDKTAVDFNNLSDVSNPRLAHSLRGLAKEFRQFEANFNHEMLSQNWDNRLNERDMLSVKFMKWAGQSMVPNARLAVKEATDRLKIKPEPQNALNDAIGNPPDSMYTAGADYLDRLANRLVRENPTSPAMAEENNPHYVIPGNRFSRMSNPDLYTATINAVDSIRAMWAEYERMARQHPNDSAGLFGEAEYQYQQKYSADVISLREALNKRVAPNFPDATVNWEQEATKTCSLR
ncbi:MAG: hypothetical protein ABSC15_09045 [Terriglobales bacterium]|jgi:hypothetical protein